MLKYLFIFLCFTPFLNLSSFASPIPPDKVPLTLATEHFEIYYYAKQQELAYLYAKQFEKALHFLGGVYISKPDKIIVVLNDSLDQANGFATRTPYPYIMLYPVLPDLSDSISEFETWSLELATHELAHVLQFEPAGDGVVKTLRSIFGTIVAPNLLLPSWWKEGSSVWAETAISEKGGRLRSIYQESILRSWVGERNFLDFTIAEANEALPDWPYGSRPYLFGSLTMSYIVQKHGEKVLQELGEQHGRSFPYLYDRITEPLANQSYREIYEESLLNWEDKARKQISKLSQIPLDQPTQVVTPDVIVRSPSFSGDGKYLAWVGQDKRPEARLKLVELDAQRNMGPIQELGKEGEIKEARFFPKSYKILFNEIKPASQVEAYSDLYIYDILKQKKTRLTKKLRGREARVNPSETEAVFIGLEGGRTTLRTIDLETKALHTLFTSQIDERLASPLYLNDSEILYSFLQKGKESLFIWDLKSKTSRLFNSEGQRLRRPLKIGSEIWIMSDLNHVFNLYEVTASGQLSNPKTHVKTTLLDYAVDPQSGSVYAVTMNSDGPKLSYFPAEMLKKEVKALPIVDSLIGQSTSLPAATEVDSGAKPIDRAYHLWPHYWIPFISGSSASKGILVSVSTSGSDPTLQHSYGLGVVYDTGIEEFSYNLGYENRAFKWPWALSSARAARSFVGTDSVYYNQAHSFSILPDTSIISDDWSTSLSYVYSKYEDDYITYERNGPQATFSFSNAKQSIWMISPEHGGDASVTYAHYNKSFYVNEYNQYLLKGAYYFSHWLPERHAIALEARALVTDRKIPSILGNSSTIYASPLTSSFLIRGYLDGQFVGRNIYNANLEYRFPILSYAKWHGLFPFYLKKVHAAVVADSIAVDGYGYKESLDTNVRLDREKVFGSAGVEIKADTTVGYVIPVEFVLGIHSPFQTQFSKNPSAYVQINSGIGF
jgi:hypothetical protein